MNDPVQFAKRTKTVEMVVHEDGSINYVDDKGVKLTFTVPIDMSSETIAALNGSGAYGEFLRRFPNAKEIKDRVIAGAEEHVRDYRQFSLARKKQWWKTDPGMPPIQWKKDISPEDLKDAVTFIGENRLIPYLISDEDVLHGPAAFQRKGNASDGLQQIGQRLNAALAPGTSTGH